MLFLEKECLIISTGYRRKEQTAAKEAGKVQNLAFFFSCYGR